MLHEHIENLMNPHRARKWMHYLALTQEFKYIHTYVLHTLAFETSNAYFIGCQGLS